MKRAAWMMVVVGIALVLPFLASNGFAQSLPSTKAAIDISSSVLLGTEYDVWTPILTAPIKMPEQKDLYMGVSLVTSLVTETLVKSKGGSPDTSSAEVMVKVRVLLDPGTALERVAAPGEVVYDRRRQELMAKFGGVLNCSDLNGDGVITFDECSLTDEELKLILDTEAAHHFNFVIDDLGAGVHTVRVEALLHRNTSSVAGSASASGFVGKGSLIIEEVRLAKDVTL